MSVRFYIDGARPSGRSPNRCQSGGPVIVRASRPPALLSVVPSWKIVVPGMGWGSLPPPKSMDSSERVPLGRVGTIDAAPRRDGED